jgi:hypothetical protein
MATEPHNTNGDCQEQHASLLHNIPHSVHGNQVTIWIDGVSIATQSIMVKAGYRESGVKLVSE